MSIALTGFLLLIAGIALGFVVFAPRGPRSMSRHL
jgi:hypothetical protein